MMWTLKYFKLPSFLVPRFCDWIMWVVETELHIFLGKQIPTLSLAAHIKLSTTVHARSHRFSLLPLSILLSHLPLPAPHLLLSHNGWWN
jgi:hypothetical protein